MSEDTPESRFAKDLTLATQTSPAITAFVATVLNPGLSQMDLLNQVAGIAYRCGGLNDQHSAELLRVWTMHDPNACRRFFMEEERDRAGKKIRELELANESYAQTVKQLQDQINSMQKQLDGNPLEPAVSVSAAAKLGPGDGAAVGPIIIEDGGATYPDSQETTSGDTYGTNRSPAKKQRTDQLAATGLRSSCLAFHGDAGRASYNACVECPDRQPEEEF